MHSVGVIHQTTCSYSPQQNGVAERKNRHILEITRSLLIGGHVPTHLWGEALNSAVYLINRTPSSVLNFRRPLDALSDHCTLPPVVLLAPRVFGCVVYVHIHPHQRSKLDSWALKCVFVGYGMNQKGYRCYHPSSRKFYVSADVIFHEKELFYTPSINDSSLQGENQDEVLHHEDLHWFFPLNSNISHNQMTKDNSTICLDENNWTSTIAETNPLHDSTSSPNTLSEPLSQSSPEIPLEVLSNSTLEDNIDLESQSSQYHLPPRSTRGIPPIRYEPDPKAKVKYPIGDHVSSQKLSKSYASYVLQLSSVSIPSKMQEALADARWTKAMEEEMAALEKNAT
ncbi:hypothetical protein UlMin_024761 [Ulmus minor]